MSIRNLISLLSACLFAQLIGGLTGTILGIIALMFVITPAVRRMWPTTPPKRILIDDKEKFTNLVKGLLLAMVISSAVAIVVYYFTSRSAYAPTLALVAFEAITTIMRRANVTRNFIKSQTE